MAHVAMQSLHVTGGVAGENILEGLAVTLSASGLHADLPTVMVAASGSRDVYVAICPPDQFPRPTASTWFQRNWNETISPRDASEFLVDSGQRGPYYLIGPSLLQNPTIMSGWVVQCHKGGAYTLGANCFVDSASIRNIGARVEVGTGGKFQYTAVVANGIGHVREYRDGKLTVVLDARSS